MSWLSLSGSTGDRPAFCTWTIWWCSLEPSRNTFNGYVTRQCCRLSGEPASPRKPKVAVLNITDTSNMSKVPLEFAMTRKRFLPSQQFRRRRKRSRFEAFSIAEINYSTTLKEFLYIVAISKFLSLLYGELFVVVTDDHSQCWLEGLENPHWRLAS